MSIIDDFKKQVYEQGYAEGMRDAVKHGHWEDYLKSGLKYRCSFCKSRFNTAWEYCPHCGAKMDRFLEEENAPDKTNNITGR